MPSMAKKLPLPTPGEWTEQRQQQQLQTMYNIAQFSTRTKVEMEVGALNIGVEQWLRHVSYMMMVEVMYHLAYPTTPSE